ncbi:Ferrous iron transport protein B [Thermosyntropha lipolytica DSM 11003]|uniref:Ferrous iron transport protein B n=1 Tax=Thermosyntropha lipolytica DSM 11003 TaxID=1123382 RepID=A0A1M5N3F7_9FIRM|nr:FeoB small GTPase domain-containing protein [Thermosyntropha lipolytica]SHG84104.1 Ferrous iron transport protein B [Thermosyntropha lipolytica DSM 11003]
MDAGHFFKVRKRFNIHLSSADEPVIALAGNPNTGKSTLFNSLTGLRQHTGNWPGKTVIITQGEYAFAGRTYKIVDLPGTYSLLARSSDELVARDFICFACPDVTVVVVDATCLERNLNLVLQILEITDKVIVCVNLIDEAERKSIYVNTKALAEELGVPVVEAAARKGIGIEELKSLIRDMVEGKIKTSPRVVRYDDDLEALLDRIQEEIKAWPGSRFINPRWLALRVLDGDESIWEGIRKYWMEESGVLFI